MEIYAKGAHCVFCAKRTTCLFVRDLYICTECYREIDLTVHKGLHTYYGAFVTYEELKAIKEKYDGH